MGVAATRFVVIGAGGLGCPVLSALVAAGARELVVIDPDVVDATNLARQVLYALADVGAAKVDAAAYRLRARVPALSVQAIRRALTPDDLPALVAEQPPGTIVLECTDSPALKFAANDAALACDRALVVGAAIGWRGQAMAVVGGDRACYRCIYEAPPPLAAVPRCADAGVLGPGVGLVGHVMASLAVAIAGGAADDVAGTLSDLDLARATVRRLAPRRRHDCPAHPDALARHAAGEHPVKRGAI